MPYVSVVIPTHNRPDMLAEALASVRAQTFTDYEIVVVLNGPMTPEIQRSSEIAERLGAKVTWLERANLPLARNVGIETASGEFVAFLDDDDLWMPHKLEAQIAAARVHNADMVSCHAIIDDRGVAHGQHFIPHDTLSLREELMLRNKFPAGGSGMMVRRAKLRQIGGFDPAMIGVEDWDCWRRLAMICTHANVDDYLVRYRYHGGNLSFAISWNHWDRRELLKALSECPPELAHMRAKIRIEMLIRRLKGPVRFLNRITNGRLYMVRRWLRPRTRLIEFRRWLSGATHLCMSFIYRLK